MYLCVHVRTNFPFVWPKWCPSQTYVLSRKKNYLQPCNVCGELWSLALLVCCRPLSYKYYRYTMCAGSYESVAFCTHSELIIPVLLASSVCRVLYSSCPLHPLQVYGKLPIFGEYLQISQKVQPFFVFVFHYSKCAIQQTVLLVAKARRTNNTLTAYFSQGDKKNFQVLVLCSILGPPKTVNVFWKGVKNTGTTEANDYKEQQSQQPWMYCTCIYM